MSSIEKININDLDVGMVVVKFDKGGFSFPHYGRPFPDKLLKQHLIKNGVNYVYIRKNEEEQRIQLTPEESVDLKEIKKIDLSENFSTNFTGYKAEGNAAFMDSSAFTTFDEINKAAILHNHTKEVTENILMDARLGKVVDTGSAKDVVSDLVESCIQSPEAFVNMTRLKDHDRYTFAHSVNVSVLAIAIGRRLGCSAQEMSNLGFAGLLHDVGKMMVPEGIINKPEKLTDDEYATMKKHPAFGVDYLSKDKNISSDILYGVHQHHEKVDGTGYPDGLAEADIHRFAKIIAIADVYDAVTTERSYHKGIMPSDALKMIFSWSGSHFSEPLAKFFISVMGIYPVSTLVILNTNELAVILEPNRDDPMRPKILIISDTNMEPIRPIFFNLATYNVATGLPYKTIISALDPRDFSINANRIIEQYTKVTRLLHK